MIPPTIEWAGDRVRLIDQRLLPSELVIVEASTVEELCVYIRTLAVRGAPALGAAGAMGVALARVRGGDTKAAGEALIATRPTAINLAWGVRRALAADDPVAEAVRIAEDDVRVNRAIGANGASLLEQNARVLTHCNTGSLACVGYGTALGVVRAAHERGRAPTVWVDETRPLRQGARLTAWELARLGIPCTVIADAMAASLMRSGEVDVVLVGADRIAANGDVANKIGTYGLAVAAHHHGVPFYVAAPRSTFDESCPTGDAIPIERRAGEELGEVPVGVDVDNRAFDVTPAALVTGYITEDGPPVSWPPCPLPTFIITGAAMHNPPPTRTNSRGSPAPRAIVCARDSSPSLVRSSCRRRVRGNHSAPMTVSGSGCSSERRSSQKCTFGPTVKANNTVPTPTLPPRAKPMASTDSSRIVRTTRTE